MSTTCNLSAADQQFLTVTAAAIADNYTSANRLALLPGREGARLVARELAAGLRYAYNPTYSPVHTTLYCTLKMYIALLHVFLHKRCISLRSLDEQCLTKSVLAYTELHVYQCIASTWAFIHTASEPLCLDLYSGTGGFALNCAAGGAASVLAVEQAHWARTALRTNALRNGLSPK
eukprot:14360-Heterococcus_DN1.PRE.3